MASLSRLIQAGSATGRIQAELCFVAQSVMQASTPLVMSAWLILLAASLMTIGPRMMMSVLAGDG